MSSQTPVNRLNPGKCPFCSPSTIMCGWPGHKPGELPQEIGAAERGKV